MSEHFKEDLQDVYSKTMKLAIDLSQNRSKFSNAPPSSNDKKYLKKYLKFYKDFQDLTKEPKSPNKTTASQSDSPNISSLGHNKTQYLPKDSGKQKLHSSLKERTNFVSVSRAGKPTDFQEIGPGVLSKLRLLSTSREESTVTQVNEKSLTLPHVSVLTGKVKPALELPSFKEYIKSERSKDNKDLVIEKIGKCQNRLEEFKKELTGLEIFVNSNPGVAWNNDKKVLLKLSAHPNQKNSIIKAYNEANFKKTSCLKIKSRISKTSTLSSKTPGPEGVKFDFSNARKGHFDPLPIVENCFTGFRNVRETQNRNLISIMESLKVARPVSLSEKAKYILNDNEKFRDRGYSLRKMTDIKKKIDFDHMARVKKSLRQVSLYDKIMEFLKKKSGGPNDTDINFVEIIKDILEEGWFLDEKTLSKTLEEIDENEIKELQPLLDFIRNELADSDNGGRASYK